MQVIILFSNGLTRIIEVDPEDTISNAKKLIHERTDVPPCYQRLVFAGRELEDERIFNYYNIQRGSVIHISTLMRGD